MILAIGTTGQIVMLLADMPDDRDEKDAMMWSIGYRTSREKHGMLKEVVFIMEGWMGTDIDQRPSRDPNRVEVLLFFRYTVKGKRTDFVAYKMVRWPDTPEFGAWGGKLGSLVKHHDTRADEKGEAESVLIEEFMKGYHAGRKGRMPRPSGGQG